MATESIDPESEFPRRSHRAMDHPVRLCVVNDTLFVHIPHQPSVYKHCDRANMGKPCGPLCFFRRRDGLLSRTNAIQEVAEMIGALGQEYLIWQNHRIHKIGRTCLKGSRRGIMDRSFRSY